MVVYSTARDAGRIIVRTMTEGGGDRMRLKNVVFLGLVGLAISLIPQGIAFAADSLLGPTIEVAATDAAGVPGAQSSRAPVSAKIAGLAGPDNYVNAGFTMTLAELRTYGKGRIALPGEPDGLGFSDAQYDVHVIMRKGAILYYMYSAYSENGSLLTFAACTGEGKGDLLGQEWVSQARAPKMSYRVDGLMGTLTDFTAVRVGDGLGILVHANGSGKLLWSSESGRWGTLDAADEVAPGDSLVRFAESIK